MKRDEWAATESYVEARFKEAGFEEHKVLMVRDPLTRFMGVFFQKKKLRCCPLWGSGMVVVVFSDCIVETSAETPPVFVFNVLQVVGW